MEDKASINAQLFGYRPSRGDATRLKILEAAINLMAHEGLESITFDILGEKVGLGKANVRYHFKDKQDIFLAAIKLIVITAQEITLAELAKAQTPDEQLSAIIHAAFSWFEKFPAHPKVWLLFWNLSSRNAEYLALHHQVRSMGAQRIAEILKAFKSSKLNDKKALLYARHIQKMITSEMVEHETCAYTEKMRDRVKFVTAIIKQDLLGFGIKWKV